MQLTEVLRSKNHRQNPFSHQMPGGQILSITTEKKTQIIALSVLIGIFTLGIGGVLLFYSLAAKYKVEKIKQFTNEAAERTNALVSQNTKPLPLPAALLSHICAYLPSSDLNNFAKVNQKGRLVGNNQLIRRAKQYGLHQTNPDIRSANAYLLAPFKAINLMAKTYPLPDGICVYDFPDTQTGLNAEKTIQNLQTLSAEQLYPLLLKASKEGHTDVVQLLLEKGADPIHCAIMCDSYEMVSLLLQRKVDMNKLSRKGLAPLHVAVVFNNINIARLLLEKGASPNIPAYNRNAPLHWAAEQGHDEMVRLLLERGANINQPGFKGHTPLDLAHLCRHRNVVQLLEANRGIRART